MNTVAVPKRTNSMLILGAILVGIGVLAVIGRAADVDLGGLIGEQTWPLLVIVPGLVLLALGLASAATLVVPIAVRRVIDFGFSDQGRAYINAYFALLIVVVGVLALASALRYYFVITLGDESKPEAEQTTRRAVPDVRGLPLRQQVKVLHEAGFRVSIARGAEGGTSPAAGSLARTGTTVRLFQPR